MNAPLRRLWRSADFWAILAAVGLAVAASWPTAAHFFTQVPGDLLSDRDQNLWNLWWVKRALLDLMTNPYHTPLLYYPDGVDLYTHTLALPNGLIGLGPLLLAGLPAAYNTVVLVALALAVYGGFRLVRYVLQTTALVPRPAWLVAGAALAGGIVFGLHTYGLDALKGQTEVLSYGWMPLYAEAWLRAWHSREGRAGARWAVLAGVFFVITLLTSFYYGVYLALFTVGHLLWRGLAAWRAGGGRAFLRQGAGILAGAGVPGLLLLPYLIGVLNSILSGAFALDAADQQARNSADLLSLFVPPRTHPWLGAGAPWWGVVNPAVHDYLWPGWIAPLLAGVGLAAQRRQGAAWGWALGVVGAALLALGPVLQINGNAHPGGLTLPLPWAVLQDWPVFNAVGKIERFLVPARLGLAPLAGWGALAIADFGFWILDWRNRGRRLQPEQPQSKIQNPKSKIGILITIIALLLLELPWRLQPTHPIQVPAGFAQIADWDEGGLLELPLVAGQVRAMGARMRYQTEHGRPIVGGYLARAPRDPLPECAPVWGLITWEPDIAERDIISPHIMSHPLVLMQRLGFHYYAIYNSYDPAEGNPLRPGERANFAALAAATSLYPPVYQDADVTLYYVQDQPTAAPGALLQLGGGWGGLETSGDRPFRWMQGGDAALCVQGGAGQTVRLALRATSFAQDRTLQLGLDGRAVLTGTIPAGGQFATLTTTLTLPSDSVRLTLHVPEGSTTPASLGQGNDERPLSLGFTDLRLEPEK